MFKTFSFQARRSDRNHAQFMDHWLNIHAPITHGVDGVRGYVLNEIVGCAPLGSLPLLPVSCVPDGVAQLWFDGAEARAAVVASPAAQRWFKDGPNYIGASAGFTTEESILSPAGREPTEKQMILLQRAPNIDRVSFVADLIKELSKAIGNAHLHAGLAISAVQGDRPATGPIPAIDLAPVDAVVECWSVAGASNSIEQLLAPLASAYGAAGAYQLREIVVIHPPGHALAPKSVRLEGPRRIEAV